MHITENDLEKYVGIHGQRSLNTHISIYGLSRGETADADISHFTPV